MIRALSTLGPDSVLGSLLRMPLRLIPRNSVVSVRAGLNKGARWRVGSSIHKCWLGTYESEKQELLSRLVSPGMVVWDVGANAGFYTLALSRLVGDAGRVYAFEPFAENADNILNHVRLNNLNNAVVVQAAMWESSGLVGFHRAPLNAMGHVSRDENSYLVPTITPDEFVANHPEARPNLLKVDVEGAEAGLLRGATGILRDGAPDIVLALHGRQQSQLCLDQLTSHGYSLFKMDGTPLTDAPGERSEIYAQKGAATARASSHVHASAE